MYSIYFGACKKTWKNTLNIVKSSTKNHPLIIEDYIFSIWIKHFESTWQRFLFIQNNDSYDWKRTFYALSEQILVTIYHPAQSAQKYEHTVVIGAQCSEGFQLCFSLDYVSNQFVNSPCFKLLAQFVVNKINWSTDKSIKCCIANKRVTGASGNWLAQSPLKWFVLETSGSCWKSSPGRGWF